MSEQEAQDRLHTLGGGWQLNAAGHLEQRFRFSDFMGAMRFANAVAEAAEAANHHPDLTITWGMCAVEILDSRHRRAGGGRLHPRRNDRNALRARVDAVHDLADLSRRQRGRPRPSTPMPHYSRQRCRASALERPQPSHERTALANSASAASARFSSDTGGVIRQLHPSSKTSSLASCLILTRPLPQRKPRTAPSRQTG